MKKIIASILSLAIILSLTACGGGNSLLKKASKDNWLRLYKYDGEKITDASLSDPAAAKELLHELSSVSANEAHDWSPEKLSMPIYAICTEDKKGNSIQAAWSNGYWIAQDGTVYSFDYDFSVLEDYFELPDQQTLVYFFDFPCYRFFCQDGDTWAKDLLIPSECLNYVPEEYEDISITVKSYSGNSLTVELKNNGNEPYFPDRFFYLSVLMDGVWYVIPSIPGDWLDQSFEVLLVKSSREETLDLSCFGNLPPGEYQLISHSMSIPFTVE